MITDLHVEILFLLSPLLKVKGQALCVLLKDTSAEKKSRTEFIIASIKPPKAEYWGSATIIIVECLYFF